MIEQPSPEPALAAPVGGLLPHREGPSVKSLVAPAGRSLPGLSFSCGSCGGPVEVAPTARGLQMLPCSAEGCAPCQS